MVTFKSKIEGSVLIGGSMSIDNFAAKIDLLTGDGEQENWKPKFNFDPKKDFQASGKVTASLALAVPVEFIMGIKIYRE